MKYVVIKDVDEATKEKLKERLEKDYQSSLKELEELYKEELASHSEKKKQSDITKLYEENKLSLESEFSRIKSILSDLRFSSTILESDYRNIFSNFPEIPLSAGPEGVLKMLQNIDVEKEIKEKVREYPSIKSADQRKKSMNLIKLLINLYVSGVRPENMIVRKLPVIPPDLRPVVQLDGGRFASSDVNLFYRRVLMRNIRLKKMIQVGMPDVVKKNEIRLLQESVNNLLVGEKNSTGRGGAGVKVFKSLSDMLSGKEGVFRKNLLGKRVDYSGRSIITVGPDLKLDECGLPIDIAVKMFTPFIIGKLIDKKIAYTPKQAEKLIREEDPIALRFLEEVIKDKYVLLNRAPTLHRLSIEAFKIKLMPGKTIRIHPLVCPAFNADFDGDQMAVHLPISDEAQREAKELIASDKNIIKPGSGEPTITHSQDMVLGIYFLTDFFDKRYPDYNTEAERKEKIFPVARFASVKEVLDAYGNKQLQLKDKIIVLDQGNIIETTTGRVIFNSSLPEKHPFLNQKMGNRDLKKLLSQIFDEYDMETTVKVADAIKDLGFKYSTIAATSINVLDMKIPKEKEAILKSGDLKNNEVLKFYYKGFLSEKEKHRLVVEIWTNVKKEVENNLKPIIGPGNNLYTMIDSGARGSQTHLTQICGMKGLVVNPQGEIIELPIKTSFVEGLKPIEYFISAHAGRKGKADTALRTAESGYLTRKLCDASQEAIVRTDDCGTTEYIAYSKEEAEIKGEKFANLIYGRTAAEDIVDEKGIVLVKAGEMISKAMVGVIVASEEISRVPVRSPLTCYSSRGVCQKCYGMDLSTREEIAIGVPVGVIAAQSIGEPSTQLTLDTFHAGGVAGGEDMATGIDRVKQLFEVRVPKNPAGIAPFDGTLDFEETPEGGRFGRLKIISEMQKRSYLLKDGYILTVKEGDLVEKGAVYASKGTSKLKTKEAGTVLETHSDYIILGVQEVYSKSLVGLSPRKTKV